MQRTVFSFCLSKDFGFCLTLDFLDDNNCAPCLKFEIAALLLKLSSMQLLKCGIDQCCEAILDRIMITLRKPESFFLEEMCIQVSMLNSVMSTFSTFASLCVLEDYISIV